MKRNKLYYILFVLYILATAFVLYVNGIFTGNVASFLNLAINGVFLLVIGILFVICGFSFARLNRCTDELVRVTEEIQKEYKEAGEKNLWASYCERKELFQDVALKDAFGKYLMRMKTLKTRYGYTSVCDVEEYINEDLLDQAGMTHFNSAMGGTLTGLGILGTFLGLSMGLGSFNGNDIYTISDNVGPLLSGMKVAFHTSVYGIFFSLVFNFVYRSLMADAYGKLDGFLAAFRQCVLPQPVSERENSASMLVYQAGMADSMKKILELLKGNAEEQTRGVERIVAQVMETLEYSMGASFASLGDTMRSAGEAQMAYAESGRQLTEAAEKFLDSSRALQASVAQEMERQVAFARELREQKEDLAAACREMTEDVGNQIHTFHQMRNLYEK